MQHSNWRYISLNPFEKDSVARRREAGILSAILLIFLSKYKVYRSGVVCSSLKLLKGHYGSINVTV